MTSSVPPSQQSGIVEPGSIGDAVLLATRVHLGQWDRSGEPHINHVRRVVELVPEDCLAVAWLHDTLEDSSLTPDALFDLGYDTRTIHAVITLTRNEAETYATYIKRIATRTGEVGRIARRVKEADLIDNLTRCLRDGDDAQVRYRMALPVIQQAMVGR